MRVRILLRRLSRSRVFVLAAVVVLALGLGANLVLFNSAYALLWRPLGFAEPDRLVTLAGRSKGGDPSQGVTGHDGWILREQKAVVAAAGLVGGGGLVTLLQGEEPLSLPAAAVDSGYFQALGVRPLAGRLFSAEEDLGAIPEPRAILTESAWRTYLGADPSVAGQVVYRLDGAGRRPLRIVGIAPGTPTLPFVAHAEILLPIASASAGVRENMGDVEFWSVVRLQPGVAPAHASAVVDAAIQSAQRGSKYGVWGQHWMAPLRSALAPVDRQTMLWLYGSACLLLALTCANLASLFVARAAARTHETSVHLALGASRWRLLSAGFEEALLVCAAGTALAFLLESWARPLVPRYLPALKWVGPELLATGPVLLLFGFLICVGTSLVVSAASARRVRMDRLAEALSREGRGSSPEAGRARAVLAAAQLAIVLTLLTLAGLIGRSFLSALRTDPGLDPRGVVTFQAAIPGSQRSLAAIAELERQIASVPGVAAVVYSAESPVGSPAFATTTTARDGALLPSDPTIAHRLVSPAYFETLGARLVAGRGFSAEEVGNGKPVVVLNQAAARLLFRGEDPIGRVVHAGFLDRRSLVVGVVRDIRTEALDRAPAPMVYMAYLPGFGLRFHVRTGAVNAVVPMIKARVREWNSSVLLQQFKPLQETVDGTVRNRSVAGALIGGFALLGLIVSAVGLYGTLAAHVEQRRREIGVRIALGATGRAVVAGVLAEGARILAFGAAAGVVGSIVSARVVQKQLYSVSPLDPASFALALILLAGTALAACLIPALRAARVDPIQALNVQ